MTKELWINLPVKDANKSKEFFANIGFTINEQHSTPESACVLVGSKGIVVMLFQEAMFKSFTNNELADTAKSTEVLFSFDAESREEVDVIAEKVRSAGGKMYTEPAEHQGWMYGCAFIDLDGHRWNILYMDMSKLAN